MRIRFWSNLEMVTPAEDPPAFSTAIAHLEDAVLLDVERDLDLGRGHLPLGTLGLGLGTLG